MYIKNFQVSMHSEHSQTQKESISITSFKEYLGNSKTKETQQLLNAKETNVLSSDFIIQELTKAIMRNLFLLYKMGYTDNESTQYAYTTQTTNQAISRDVTIVKRTYDSDYSYFEEESMSFQTEAYIQTDNGEFQVDVEINLHRSFMQRHHVTSTAKFIDPLILSFDGTTPDLKSEKFCFDIDCDGESDQISTLGEKSAFLSLDLNNNGTIDDGSELFGTKSGNGFMDLKAYDMDGNNWIDEADDIFDKLRIWQKTDEKSQILALGEVGIGAIFLGNKDTEFSIKNQNNTSLGKIQKSGFFLNEDGTSGMISQIDFAKEDKSEKDLKSVFASSNKKEEKKSNSPLFELEERIKELQTLYASSTPPDKKILKEQIVSLNRKLSNLKKSV